VRQLHEWPQRIIANIVTFNERRLETSSQP
jgi:hypothetical protein